MQEAITITILFISLYFEIFLLITYIEKSSKIDDRHNHAGTDLPGVTIIIPCYNEEKTAAGTINSLLNIDYPANKLSIIAVNDGSTDNTAVELEKFSDNERIRIVHKENGGKHTALNLGIKMANTEFVGCLDADSFASKDSLKRIISRFKSSEIMAVVPSLHVHNPRNLLQKMQRVEYTIGVFFRNILSELNALYVTPGPFSIFRKSVFEKIGYYHKAHNTEDMEMALRMQNNRYKIACAPDAIVFTTSPKNVKALYKQRTRWTSGFLHNIRDYKHLLFDTKYGHIGILVLPIMLISMFSAIYVLVSMIMEFISRFNLWYIKLDALGFKAFELKWPSFDLFFFHASPLAFGGFIAFIIMISFIVIGSRLSKLPRPNIIDIVAYSLFYIILAPTWLSKSIFNFVFSKQAVWR